MDRLKQLITMELSFLSNVTITLAIILFICLLNPGTVSLFASLLSLLTASTIILIYLVITWVRLSKVDRWSIVISIVAWLLVAYGLIHANGLTISVLLGLYD